jgi:hypothetical protein
MAEIEHMSKEHREQNLQKDREFCKNRFAQYKTHKIENVFHFLGLFSAYAKLEEKHDDKMFALIPQADKFVGIFNAMIGYQATQEWYSKFKEMIDSSFTIDKS